MSSPDLQAKANALNARLEGEAKIVVDDIERNLLRSVARNAYACVVKCYDNAGKNGSAEALDNCSRQCQKPYQMANNIVQQEVGQFQNRISRAMMQCNDDASAMITPDVQNDARKMKKVEDAVIGCISRAVDSHVKQLGPLKQRVASQLKEL